MARAKAAPTAAQDIEEIRARLRRVKQQAEDARHPFRGGARLTRTDLDDMMKRLNRAWLEAKLYEGIEL